MELEKNEGPATTIGVLGLELDTVALEVRLPQDKLENLKSSLAAWIEGAQSLPEKGTPVSHRSPIPCLQGSESGKDILSPPH